MSKLSGSGQHLWSVQFGSQGYSGPSRTRGDALALDQQVAGRRNCTRRTAHQRAAGRSVRDRIL